MPSEHHVVKIFKPFSPHILKSEINENIIKKLNDQCDDILKDEKQRKEVNVAESLVGHVQEELNCDLTGHVDFGETLYNLTKCLYAEWVTNGDKNNTHKIEKIKRIAVHSAWYVRQFKNDYNPAHHHKFGSQYSCILFLKVPDSIKPHKNYKYKNKASTEGHTDFMYGAHNTLTQSNFLVCPKVGDLYIFPSFLTHAVYPFYGEGERRSFSANMSLE